VRVLLAEDSAVLRDGLARLLFDHGHEVVAAVGDGDGILPAAEQSSPDVAVLDIRMPPTYTDDGLRAALALRRHLPEIGVLVFSQYVETRYATLLLAENPAGVGYLLKDRVADVREFMDALTRVAGGGTALDPDVVRQLVSTSKHQATLAEALTVREGDVLSLMAEGRTNSAIAAALVVSEGAVEKHVANIFAKLDLFPSQDDNRRVLAVLRFLNN
jgi:DNA-binding NarL/FixJ family response regulator